MKKPSENETARWRPNWALIAIVCMVAVPALFFHEDLLLLLRQKRAMLAVLYDGMFPPPEGGERARNGDFTPARIVEGSAPPGPVGSLYETEVTPRSAPAGNASPDRGGELSLAPLRQAIPPLYPDDMAFPEARSRDAESLLFFSEGRQGPANTAFVDAHRRMARLNRGDDPQIDSLVTQAWGHHGKGDFEAAKRQLEQALALAKAKQWDYHSDYPERQTDLAVMLIRLGDYAAAMPMLEAARKRLEAPHRISGVGFGPALPMLTSLEAARERLAAPPRIFGVGFGPALPMLTPGRDRERDGPSRQVLQYARTLGVMAKLLVEQGSHDLAWPLVEEAEQVCTQNRAISQPGYAKILSLKAGLLREQGSIDEAKRLYEQALAVMTSARGSEDRDVAIIEANLGFLSIEKDDLPSARPTLERARAITELLGEEHPDHVRIQAGLAWLRHLQGDRPGSQALFEKARTTVLATPRGYPDLARAMSSLGWLLAETGDRQRAIELIGRACDAYHGIVANNLGVLPERQRLALINRYQFALDSALTLTADWPGEDARAYGRLLSWKGLVDSRAGTRRLDSASTEVLERAAELNRLRAELTRLYYARVPDKDVGKLNWDIRTAAERCAVAETRLARALGTPRAPLEPARVADALPPNSALIDLSRYVHIQRSRPSEVRYVAFVTRLGKPSRRVELGGAPAIDTAVVGCARIDPVGQLPRFPRAGPPGLAAPGASARRSHHGPRRSRRLGQFPAIRRPGRSHEARRIPHRARMHSRPSNRPDSWSDVAHAGGLGAGEHLGRRRRGLRLQQLRPGFADPTGFPRARRSMWSRCPAPPPRSSRSADSSAPWRTVPRSGSPAAKRRRTIYAHASPGTITSTWPCTAISSRLVPGPRFRDRKSPSTPLALGEIR